MAVSRFYGDFQVCAPGSFFPAGCAFVHFHLRNDQQCGQILFHRFQDVQCLPFRKQYHFGFQRVTDGLVLAMAFQHLGHFAADSDEVIKLGFKFFVKIFFLHFRPGQHLHGFRRIGRFLHKLPYLFHGKAQHRGNHHNKVVQDLIHGGLCAAACRIVRFGYIQAVLDDIQIEAGHFHRAEIVDGMEQHMEVIGFVGGLHFFLQLLQTH